jgi:hypothetical protein
MFLQFCEAKLANQQQENFIPDNMKAQKCKNPCLFGLHAGTNCCRNLAFLSFFFF